MSGPGGADVARQCLAAGLVDEVLVDEVQLHVVPVVAGDGLPLFARPGPAVRITPLRVVAAPGVIHCRHRVERDRAGRSTGRGVGRSRPRLVELSRRRLVDVSTPRPGQEPGRTTS
ncbi:hypothetical protein ACI798_06010 [Geodermatophilus sp. SYSU D01045]